MNSNNIVYFILSVLLIVFFFITWIDLPPIRVKMSGATIPFKLPDIFQMTISPIPNKTYILYVSYLLYLTPLLAFIHLFSTLSNKKYWFLKIDYTIALITTIIVYGILLYIDRTGPQTLSYGFWATAITAIVGILFQVIQFFVLRKKTT